MANIRDNGAHFTFRTRVGSIGDSFFFFPHWYGGNYVLVTLVDGRPPVEHIKWLDYLKERGISHKLMGRACLIAPESTEQLFLEEASFRGSSEIYVCHCKPEYGMVPSANYPPDVFDFTDGPPEGFLDGLGALDALVYMAGDGMGVNIAHKVKSEIIFFVKEMSLGD